MTYAEPPLFAAVAEPPLFGSAEQPRRRIGLSLWLAAAASLVLGIVIGFASGYRAGQGLAVAPPAAEAPAPTSGSASPGRPFSESTVSDPVRLESKEVVPNRSPQPAPAPPQQQQAAPAAPSTLREPQGRAEQGRGATSSDLPRAESRRARPATTPAVEQTPGLPAGPGSLQVLSRPAGAEVIIDGRSMGRTPLSIEMTPGRHDVRLALPGFNPWQTTVDVNPGSTARVSGSLEQ
jgi:hypothetical protein